MTKTLKTVVFLFAIFFSISSYAEMIKITIQGGDARALYNHLTGKRVEQQGAAGHLYRQGENVICKYTQADMSDKNNKEISRTDVRRYFCTLSVNENGKVKSASTD